MPPDDECRDLTSRAPRRLINGFGDGARRSLMGVGSRENNPAPAPLQREVGEAVEAVFLAGTVIVAQEFIG